MRKLAAIFAVVLISVPLWGAVTVDICNASTVPASRNTVNWSHTIGATSKLVLVAAVQVTGTTVSTVTVGSCNATVVDTQVGTFENVEIWQCPNPPTGAQTITVNWSGTALTAAASCSFLGGDGSIGTPAKNTGTASPATLTITSATNDLTFSVVSQDQGTCSTDTATPNGTAESNICTNSDFRLATQVNTGAASVTSSWTLVTSLTWDELGVNVQVAAPASTSAGNKKAKLQKLEL